MIKFILTNTEKEETQAHEAEKTAQHDFEDSMKKLKDDEATLLGNLEQLKLDLGSLKRSCWVSRQTSQQQSRIRRP